MAFAKTIALIVTLPQFALSVMPPPICINIHATGLASLAPTSTPSTTNACPVIPTAYSAMQLAVCSAIPLITFTTKLAISIAPTDSTRRFPHASPASLLAALAQSILTTVRHA